MAVDVVIVQVFDENDCVIAVTLYGLAMDSLTAAFVLFNWS